MVKTNPFGALAAVGGALSYLYNHPFPISTYPSIPGGCYLGVNLDGLLREYFYSFLGATLKKWLARVAR
jgi:hypothetical protein